MLFRQSSRTADGRANDRQSALEERQLPRPVLVSDPDGGIADTLDVPGMDLVPGREAHRLARARIAQQGDALAVARHDADQSSRRIRQLQERLHLFCSPNSPLQF